MHKPCIARLGECQAIPNTNSLLPNNQRTYSVRNSSIIVRDDANESYTISGDVISVHNLYIDTAYSAKLPNGGRYGRSFQIAKFDENGNIQLDKIIYASAWLDIDLGADDALESFVNKQTYSDCQIGGGHYTIKEYTFDELDPTAAIVAYERGYYTPGIALKDTEDSTLAGLIVDWGAGKLWVLQPRT